MAQVGAGQLGAACQSMSRHTGAGSDREESLQSLHASLFDSV